MNITDALLRELGIQIEEQRLKNEIYEVADNLNIYYEAFVRAGFSEEQSFNIIITLITISMSNGGIK